MEIEKRIQRREIAVSQPYLRCCVQYFSLYILRKERIIFWRYHQSGYSYVIHGEISRTVYFTSFIVLYRAERNVTYYITSDRSVFIFEYRVECFGPSYDFESLSSAIDSFWTVFEKSVSYPGFESWKSDVAIVARTPVFDLKRIYKCTATLVKTTFRVNPGWYRVLSKPRVFGRGRANRFWGRRDLFLNKSIESSLSPKQCSTKTRSPTTITSDF